MQTSDELTAVTAHWLLGRLTVLQSSVRLLGDDDGLDLDPETTAVIHARATAVMGQIQGALEDMARGLPPIDAMTRAR